MKNAEKSFVKITQRAFETKFEAEILTRPALSRSPCIYARARPITVLPFGTILYYVHALQLFHVQNTRPNVFRGVFLVILRFLKHFFFMKQCRGAPGLRGTYNTTVVGRLKNGFCKKKKK